MFMSYNRRFSFNFKSIMKKMPYYMVIVSMIGCTKTVPEFIIREQIRYPMNGPPDRPKNTLRVR